MIESQATSISLLNLTLSGSRLLIAEILIPMVKWFLANYLERHRNPVNQLLHFVGLPVTFVLPIIFLTQQRELWALCAFLGGYGLQFLGHFVEGNDAGETILVKKLLGMPYSEFGPLSTQSKSND